IYVAHDSADVWAAQHLFHLEDDGEPVVVAGVPPDYFSATGQRWGNPIYRWDVMRKDRYAWWTRRLRHILQQVDLLRLDHFRAFEAYWAIPRAEETAVNGAWYPGPGAPFFETIRENLGSLDFVAEDLGIITDEVRALMRQFGLPGMAVLQFAFGGDDAHPFLPHNFHEHLVAYTGTHDNDTFAGWWFDRASTQEAEVVANEQARIRTYLHLTPEREAMIHWVGIETLMRSQARLVVFPLQDVLGLRSEARMNTPGTDHGNWAWRVQPDALTPEHGATLRRLAEESGRV
ncbi:MAG: 4-alpha-glucanotransferase, partial [Bacteroidota bacterium]